MENAFRRLKVSNIFAEAHGVNQWVCDEVYNETKSLFLPQEEVLYENLDPVILDIVHELLNRSREDDCGAEIGAILAYKRDGAIDVEFVTSGNPHNIYDYHNDEALEKLLNRADKDSIERMQYYHTHPKVGLAAMTLSMQDISETNRLQNFLLEKGVVCPLDMHAIPFDLASRGEFEIQEKPPLGSSPFDENGNRIRKIEAKPKVELKSRYIEVIPRLVRATLNPEQVVPEL